MPPAKKPAKSKTETKPAAKAPTKIKSPAKAAAKPAPAPVLAAATTRPSIAPAVDTKHAAALVGNKIEPTTASAQPESALFRNMKQSLAKPHSQIMGGLLDKIGPSGQKKSGLPFGADKQQGHNQTVGSDATRRNVPRRTGG